MYQHFTSNYLLHFLTLFSYQYVVLTVINFQGDTKGSARGADGSGKNDMIGTQLGSDAQVTYGTQLGSDAQVSSEFS